MTTYPPDVPWNYEKFPFHDAGSMLVFATGLITGDRARQNGDKVTNHARIASVWTGILHASGKLPKDVFLDEHDAANLMEGMKIARRYGGAFNPDDYVDGAGYAACALECGAAVEKRRLDSWRDPDRFAKDVAETVPKMREELWSGTAIASGSRVGEGVLARMRAQGAPEEVIAKLEAELAGAAPPRESDDVISPKREAEGALQKAREKGNAQMQAILREAGVEGVTEAISGGEEDETGC